MFHFCRVAVSDVFRVMHRFPAVAASTGFLLQSGLRRATAWTRRKPPVTTPIAADEPASSA